jgi:hypothetical protein
MYNIDKKIDSKYWKIEVLCVQSELIWEAQIRALLFRNIRTQLKHNSIVQNWMLD